MAIKDKNKIRKKRSEIMKRLWQNPEYREHMSKAHLGNKYPLISLSHIGNKYAFRNRMVTGKCVICGKEIHYYASHPRKTCSIECERELRRREMKGNKYALGNKLSEERRKEIAEFMSQNRSGPNNPNWKGGVTPEDKKIRKSVEYKLWRKTVFERDKYTCQVTGKQGGDLVVHHILNFAEHPELRFAVDNGITMSRYIHNKFHKIYGRKHNTREQLEEFIKSYKSKHKSYAKNY